ncbi:MAG: hypothetical protein ABWX67_07095, partial [Allosphingosinicella sp.]
MLFRQRHEKSHGPRSGTKSLRLCVFALKNHWPAALGNEARDAATMAGQKGEPVTEAETSGPGLFERRFELTAR